MAKKLLSYTNDELNMLSSMIFIAKCMLEINKDPDVVKEDKQDAIKKINENWEKMMDETKYKEVVDAIKQVTNGDIQDFISSVVKHDMFNGVN